MSDIISLIALTIIGIHWFITPLPKLIFWVAWSILFVAQTYKLIRDIRRQKKKAQDERPE
jgi:hypothetical protein